MSKSKVLLGVMGVLVIATSSAALPTTLYEDNINGAQYPDRWQTVPGRTRFLLDPSAWGGASGYVGGGGESLKLNAHVVGADLGVSNDLRDGSHWSDLYGVTPTTDVIAAADGYPVTLETWFATYLDWPAGNVDWEMSFSGDDHSVAFGTNANSTSNLLMYSIDGGPWLSTGATIDNKGSNTWNNISMTIRPFEIVFAVNVGGSGSLLVNGDFSDWTFHTITVLSNAADNSRAGYISQINVLGDPEFNIVPEPASLILMGLGCLAVVRRRRP